MDPAAKLAIDRLELKAHPEGGYYRETYRSTLRVPTGHGERACSTAIYFLLAQEQESRLHRIRQDEIWHFYDGTRLFVHMISAKGDYSKVHLGRDVAAGDLLQFVVPAGTWFGATVEDPGGYALVGCTVAPGFDFADFELADREEMLHSFPEHEAIIRRLTP